MPRITFEELCARAAATDDLDELSEVLSHLCAVMYEHILSIEKMVEERRHFGDLERKMSGSV